MINLGSWMNKVLTGWGVDEKIANTFDEAIIAILLVAVAIGLDYLCQAIFVGGVRSIVKHTHYKWDTLLIKRKVVHYLVHTIPGILVYALLPMAFIRGKELLFISQKICAVYIIFSLLLALNGLLLMMLDLFNQQEKMKNRPMKGFIQVLQVLVFFVGGIVIIAILVNKSPATLFAGLGASAAILMLVFKDSILGFVAGIQLSANDMLRPGDWITMPSANANGIVQEITLNTVKVQNFDNTISTIPPYNLVNSSFQNWRGMVESGGRRVMKSIYLDLNTIKFCTPEMLDTFRKEKLRDTQTTVEKNTQNAIIALLVFPIHNGQQPLAFFQCEIVGEGFWYLRGVEILHRVFLQQLRFHGQVFEEAADRGDLARTRAGAQAVFRLVRIRLPDAVARQIGQKTVNLRERYGMQEGNIHIRNGDLVQFRRARREPAVELQKSQKHPQVEIILVDRRLGMPADRFVINQKVAQHLRRI